MVSSLNFVNDNKHACAHGKASLISCSMRVRSESVFMIEIDSYKFANSSWHAHLQKCPDIRQASFKQHDAGQIAESAIKKLLVAVEKEKRETSQEK